MEGGGWDVEAVAHCTRDVRSRYCVHHGVIEEAVVRLSEKRGQSLLGKALARVVELKEAVLHGECGKFDP